MLVTMLLLATVTLADDSAWVDDPDKDNDGVHDVVDACPDSPEDRDGYLDDDGCYDPTRVFFVFTAPDGSFLHPTATIEGGGVLPDRRLIRIGVDAGSRRVQAVLEGYEPLDTMVEIPGGETHRVVLQLTPLPPGPATGS